MSSARPRRANRVTPLEANGFTLLEVLAAAVMMAAIYAVLTASNIQGVILEGDADRRLSASLLADGALADLEAQIAQGLPVDIGQRERDEGIYTVRVEVGPLELPLSAWLPEPEGADPRDRRDPRAASLLAPPGRGQAPPLRSLHVTVLWNDGVRDRQVERTTFLLDSEVTAGVLQQAGLGAAAGAPGTEDNPIELDR